VIIKTLESAPKDATHWSTRSMAREVGLTQNAVLRIWQAFGLQPHRQEAWKLSKDPQFVGKVRDVVGLYLNPPERAVVLCVDEEESDPGAGSDRADPADAPRRARACHPRLQALGHLEPVCRAGPHDRQGDRGVALPPPRGRVQEVPADNRPRGPKRARRPRRAQQLIHPQDPSHPAVARCAPPGRPPLHPDQLLLVEPCRALVRGTDRETTPPRCAQVGARTQQRHPRMDRHLERRSRPYVWTKTADQILDSIARYCERINQSRQ
jgi:hypothetical protein